MYKRTIGLTFTTHKANACGPWTACFFTLSWFVGL